MDTPHIVDFTVRARPKFKRHPHKSTETDPVGTLSSVPYGVLHMEDVRSYIHCKLEDLGIFAIFDQDRLMCDKEGILKEQFRWVTDKGFHHALNFLDNFEEEHVRYVLIRIHDHFMWLDKLHNITKEAIHVIIGLWATGEVPILRSIPKDDVSKLIKSRWDGRPMIVDENEDP